MKNLTETNTALLASLRHWEENVDKKRMGTLFFTQDCCAETCPLCILFLADHDYDTHKECPLCDNQKEPLKCCVEWLTAARANEAGLLDIIHIEAMRDRLKLECEKRELLK